MTSEIWLDDPHSENPGPSDTRHTLGGRGPSPSPGSPRSLERGLPSPFVRPLVSGAPRPRARLSCARLALTALALRLSLPVIRLTGRNKLNHHDLRQPRFPPDELDSAPP
jgi:hypothetical protein